MYKVLIIEEEKALGFGGITVGVSRVINHPDYDEWIGRGSDIAIWQLAEPIETSSDLIAYATLPSVATEDITAGADFTAVGWGLTDPDDAYSSSEVLMKVTVPGVGRTECNERYSGLIEDTMVCAGEEGKDACQEDSGGPLYEDETGIVVGVVSWGEGCGEAGFPGVYAHVGGFLDFIEENMA